MRVKNFFFVFVILATVVMIACKKEDVNKGNTDKLQGRWKQTKEVETKYENDVVVDKDTSFPSGSTIFEFKGDSVVMYRNDKVRDRYSYKINGSELLLREHNDGFFLTLKWFGKVQMSLSFEETSTSSKGVRWRYVTEMVFDKQ